MTIYDRWNFEGLAYKRRRGAHASGGAAAQNGENCFSVIKSAL